MSGPESTRESAARFWDQEVVDPTHHNWLADPAVRDYVNRAVGGDDRPSWPMNWLQREYPERRQRGLSIGCGNGKLERDIIHLGICEEVDAFDASPGSLKIAQDAATAEGIADRIHYRQDDFNCVSLPRNRYDIVFFNQSLHHVSRIERLLRHVLHALKPGGLVYVDEYIGPSRTYWNAKTLAWYRALYQLMPRELRYEDEMPLPIQWDDLSEAVRSGEILSRLKVGFRIRDFRGYGGNVLAVFFPAMRPGIPPAIVASLLNAEKSLLAAGAQPFYAVMILEPKRGLARALAELRYLVEPKSRRVAWELARRRKEPRIYAAEEDRFRL